MSIPNHDSQFFASLHENEEQDAKDEELEQMIADRADELIKGDYNPFSASNVRDAIDAFTDEQFAQIAESYKFGYPSTAGATIGNMIEEIWQNQAMITAREQIMAEIKSDQEY